VEEEAEEDVAAVVAGVAAAAFLPGGSAPFTGDLTTFNFIGLKICGTKGIAGAVPGVTAGEGFISGGASTAADLVGGAGAAVGVGAVFVNVVVVVAGGVAVVVVVVVVAGAGSCVNVMKACAAGGFGCGGAFGCVFGCD
jgi:hypothetical protein